MDSLGKKFLFKLIVETLTDIKLKNQDIIGAKKLRNILERNFGYSFSPNFLSHFIVVSLDWLVESGYLKLLKKNSPRKYLIPNDFVNNSKNIIIYF